MTPRASQKGAMPLPKEPRGVYSDIILGIFFGLYLAVAQQDGRVGPRSSSTAKFQQHVSNSYPQGFDIIPEWPTLLYDD